VVLRVTPQGADDALRWRFHSNQEVEALADGAVLVRFRASGMLELAWHLFTWGDKVRVISPPILRDTLLQQIELARRTHASDPDAGAG